MATKVEIVKKIAELMNSDAKTAEKAFDAVFDAVIDCVKTTGRTPIPNFGVFDLKMRSESMATNLRTKERIKVPARRVLVFRPSDNIKKSLNQ